VSRKRLFVVLLAMVLSLSFIYSIADARQISGGGSTGLTIVSPEQDVFPQYANITLRFYVHNVTDYKMLDNTTTNCTFYLYRPNGVYMMVTPLIYNASGFGDYSIYLDGATFLSDIETQNYYVYCNSTSSNGFVYSFYKITLNGNEPPGDNLVIFFIIAFIVVVCCMILTLFNALVKFAKLEVKAMDVAYSLMTYIALLSLWAFNMTYVADINIDNILTVFVEAGALTNIVIPLLLFFLVIYNDIMVKRKKRRAGEEI